MAAQGALAQRLRAGGSDKEKVRIQPTPRERKAARKLQLLAFQSRHGRLWRRENS